MDRIDPNSNQNGLNPQPDSSPPIRRASSRIARRNSPQSAHPRPYPQNSNYHHVQTWLAQNRQAERQRDYYANYYSTSRNRVHSHRNSQGQTTTAPTSSTSSSSSEAARTTPFERVTEIIRINNAATQTSSNTANPDEPNVASNTNTNTANNPNNPFLLTPLHDYIRTIGAFITYGTTGHAPTLVLNASGSDNNNSTNNGNANNLNIDIEPFNFDTFFGFPDNYFNDGLTKQEINRHTISYEYKPALPAKRKRVKTEEINTSTPSSSATSVNENCSICLDKFNQNVQVRRLPCLHVFHIKCIDKWLKRNKKCPICRISITINYETLMSSLESGSSIDQCLSQQESSMRAQFRPTITLSLQSNRGNSEITVSGNIVHSSMNSETAASNANAAGTN